MTYSYEMVVLISGHWKKTHEFENMIFKNSKTQNLNKFIMYERRNDDEQAW